MIGKISEEDKMNLNKNIDRPIKGVSSQPGHRAKPITPVQNTVGQYNIVFEPTKHPDPKKKNN